MTRTGWLKSFAVLLPAALCLAVFGACGGGGEPEDAPVAAPPPKEEPSEPAPERAEPEPVRRRPAPPATGGLQVSGTAGAIVFLDGREIGTVPGAWEEMDAGEYPLRVEKQGFHPFEATVTIRGGRVPLGGGRTRRKAGGPSGWRAMCPQRWSFSTAPSRGTRR